MLSGCGHKEKSKATFKVRETLSLSSTGFPGGLIISGKNLSTGTTFSQGIKDELQFTVVLEKGAWLISAVGWTSTTIFEGVPQCAKVEANLLNEQETLTLNMKSSNCTNIFFSKGLVDSQTTPHNLKKISLINTCNTFFTEEPKVTDKISSKMVTSSTSSNYCENSKIPTDLRSDVGGIKFFALNKKANEKNPTLSFSTKCLTSNSNMKSVIQLGQNGNINELRLPVGEVPFGIITFKDTACSYPIAQFIFKDGLQIGDNNKFDHLLLDQGTNDLRLILPANDLKRGLSPLSALAPSLKKEISGNQFLFETTPNSTISYDFRVHQGQPSIILEDEKECTDVNLTNYISCDDSNGQVKITINTFALPTGSTSTSITTNNNKNYIVSLEPPGYDQNRSEVQGLVMKLLGHNSNDKTARFFNLWEDKNKYGYLSEIRNMFNPNGAGGVIGIKDKELTFENACLGLIEDKEVGIYNYEKGEYDTYRVILNNEVKKTPTKFICQLNDLNPINCQNGIDFDKRLIIFDQKHSKTNPVIAIEFSCSHPVGRFESLSNDSNDILKEQVNKKIINWNTYTGSSYSKQRFELVNWTRNMTEGSLSDPIHEERSMARLFKNGNAEYEGIYYEYQGSTTSAPGMFEWIKLRRFKTSSNGTNLSFITSEESQASYFSLDIFNSQNTNIMQLITKSPIQEVSVNSFNPTDNYPQLNNTTSTIIFSPLTGTYGILNNSNKIDDSIDMRLSGFNTSVFNSSFENNFLTYP